MTPSFARPSSQGLKILQGRIRHACAVLAIAQGTVQFSLRYLTVIDSVHLLHRRRTMVDSPKERTMTDGSSNLPERVEVIEQKLDGLIQSVDARFEQVDRRFEEVDRRFDQVDAAFIEQRAYTEFAYERLDSKMDAGFARLDRRMDTGFARLESKMDTDVARLESKMDAGFARLDQKIDAGLGKVDGRFAGLERKIDQIIDLHLPRTPPDASDSE